MVDLGRAADPTARLRVLQLFDPEIKNAASADPEFVRAVRVALTLPLVSEPAGTDGNEPAAISGQPPESEVEDKRMTANRRFLRNGERSVTWQVLCDEVRSICDGWDDPNSRNKKPKPGYGDKTIRRLATPLIGKARSSSGP